MRIDAINAALNVCCVKKNCIAKSDTNIPELEKDKFEKNISALQSISFNGYKIHIVDGGLHADTMTHFARGIVKKIDDVVEVVLHRAETNKRYSGLKQMTSVRDQLKLLNEEGLAKPGEYVAIPGSAQVHLTSLADKMGLEEKDLRPENVKAYKSKIIDVLSNEYYADKLDYNDQKLYAVPEVIKQINELVGKGVNVYIPAGHPIEFVLKARAAENGVKEDLYNYIATRGRVGREAIMPIIQEIKEENIYKFNLLALSDAHVVNIRDLSGDKDYIFAAYDSCVNDGARGVFNFYPVRNKEGKILGYSFTDKHTIHYPYEEYPDNKGIENISKFVGRKMSDFSYEGNITHIMKSLMAWEEPYDELPDVLYPISCIPKKRFLKDPTLRSKGDYFTKDEKLFFDRNDQGEFIFRKCDCEGSGRPSVVAMWGSCFAAINAIKRDIAADIKRKLPDYIFGREYWDVDTLITEAEHNIYNGKLKTAEFNLNKALKRIEPYQDVVDTFSPNIAANSMLYEVLMKQKKYAEAEAVANRCINAQCRILLRNFKTAANIKDFYSIKFAHYWEYPESELNYFTEQTEKIAKWFKIVADLCHDKGNETASTMARWAADMISNARIPADALVERRANRHINIGDIYNEYHKDYEY